MNPRSDSGRRAKEVLIGLMKENKTYDEVLVSLFYALTALGECKESSTKDCHGDEIEFCVAAAFFIHENPKQRDCHGICSRFPEIIAADPDFTFTRG